MLNAKTKANGEMPRYSGKCRHLTKEQQAEKEAQGFKPSIRFKVPANETITFNDMVKDDVSFESNGIGDFVIAKKTEFRLITLLWQWMII